MSSSSDISSKGFASLLELGAADLFPDQSFGQLFPFELEHHLGVHSAEEIQGESDQAGPSGLVTGPEPGAVVAVKVLVEQNQVTPVWIILESGDAAVDRPLAGLVAEEGGRQPRESSCATSNSVMWWPEPVGHCTLKSSP